MSVRDTRARREAARQRGSEAARHEPNASDEVAEDGVHQGLECWIDAELLQLEGVLDAIRKAANPHHANE